MTRIKEVIEDIKFLIGQGSSNATLERRIKDHLKEKLPESFYPSLNPEERLEMLSEFYENSITEKGKSKINMLKYFNKTFDVDINNHPSQSKNAKLRIDLMQEELDEIKKAIQDKNYPELLDGLCDLEYVLLGTVLEFGLQDIFNIAFKEVHKSNMSKALINPTDQEVEKAYRETLEKYNDEFPIHAVISEVGSTTIVVFKNSATGKVIKPKSFRSPDFSKFAEFFKS